jgi:hypothetical protein
MIMTLARVKSDRFSVIARGDRYAGKKSIVNSARSSVSVTCSKEWCGAPDDGCGSGQTDGGLESKLPWADAYGAICDIFAVQRDISQRITRARARTRAGCRGAVDRTPTSNLDA